MNENDWKWLGLRMRDIRTQRKISMREMSEMLGLRICSLSNIELNKSHPSLELLVRIVTILDVSLDYIVRGIRPAYSSSGLIFRSDDELESSFILTEE